MPSTTVSGASSNRGNSTKTKSNNAPKNPAGGFGLLFLLLAAMPFDRDADSALNPNPECFSGARPNLATTSHLRYCASRMDAVKNAADSLLDDSDVSLDEDELRRRRGKKNNRGSSSSASAHSDCSDDGGMTGSSHLTSDDSDAELGSFAHPSPSGGLLTSSPRLTGVVPPQTSTLSTINSTLVGRVFSYLPLSDLTVCRQVSKAFGQAAQAAVPTPLPGSVFMRFEAETFRGRCFAELPPRHLLRWTCGYCSVSNNVGSSTCRSCGSSSEEGYGVRRVFFGQLRKERTTELVEWMIAQIYPDMTPLHIENHTNGTDGRGKGCAWVYLTSAFDEARLLALNKRMFIDVDDDHREGIWFCDSSYTEELGNMASSRAYKPHRPVVLARQPLVVERPQAKENPSAPKNDVSSKRFSKIPKGCTAQQLYEDSCNTRQGPSRPRTSRRIPVGFPRPARANDHTTNSALKLLC